jgi:hypothetical protein
MSNNNLLLAFPHMLNYLKFRSDNYRAEMVSMRHAEAAMIMPAAVTPKIVLVWIMCVYVKAIEYRLPWVDVGI